MLISISQISCPAKQMLSSLPAFQGPSHGTHLRLSLSHLSFHLDVPLMQAPLESGLKSCRGWDGADAPQWRHGGRSKLPGAWVEATECDDAGSGTF